MCGVHGWIRITLPDFEKGPGPQFGGVSVVDIYSATSLARVRGYFIIIAVVPVSLSYPTRLLLRGGAVWLRAQ